MRFTSLSKADYIKVLAVARHEAGSGPRCKMGSMQPRLGGSSLKQLSFNWGAKDKYTKLRHFRMEVINIFQTYDTNHEDRV